MKNILLTQKQSALIDDKNYEFLSQWKWFAHWNKCTKSYYARRNETVNGKQTTVQMHRVIMNLNKGDKRQVDHKNHDTLNNTKENLRIVTKRGNGANQRNQSKYGVGVRFWKVSKISKPFEAYTKINGKFISIGYFKTPEEAKKAREEYLSVLGIVAITSPCHGEDTGPIPVECSKIIKIHPNTS